MEDNEIMIMINAMEQDNKVVVNSYLGKQWDLGVTSFIDVVKKLRSVNSELVDNYFSKNETLSGFIQH